MSEFYVYAHLLPDGTPFYVGKGSGPRRFSKQGRSEFWWRTVRKYYGAEYPTTVVLSNGLTEQVALEVETQYIQKFGKRIDSTGSLVNLTDGGEGASYPHSQETKEKLSLMRRGVKFTPEHRLTLSESAKRRVKKNPEVIKKRVAEMNLARKKFTRAKLYNKITGQIEEVTNGTVFSRKHGLRQTAVSSLIHGKRKSYKKWILLEKE